MAGVDVFLASHNFERFCEEVQNERRYIHSPDTHDLLKRIEDALPTRILEFEEGADDLWRAQLGCDWRGPEDENDRAQNPIPYKKSRMKPCPKPSGCPEGRVNPKGIPCLYLATNRYTAVSEVRPTPGAWVTVAQFKIQRNLKIVDCCSFHRRNNLRNNDKYDDVIWTEINNAFSEPISGRDNVAEYAPTQILAELFRSKGYDGIAYKSIFLPTGASDAHNLAFFDLDAAECLEPKILCVKSLRLETVPSTSEACTAHSAPR